jgi:hypothetical protein
MKVSIDHKTIKEIPDGTLLSYLNKTINAKRIIASCFTAYDLNIGESLKLIVQLNSKRYKSVYVFAGKNLTPADLKANYNNFGRKI